MTRIVKVVILAFGFGGIVCPAPEGFLRACILG